MGTAEVMMRKAATQFGQMYPQPRLAVRFKEIAIAFDNQSNIPLLKAERKKGGKKFFFSILLDCEESKVAS